eukprot:Clim_evm5s155 gene=Clim_evmTU5s155
MATETEGIDGVAINFEKLDLTVQDFSNFDEVEEHIQQNLEDNFLKQALDEGKDLRKYASDIAKELHEKEEKSIQTYLKKADATARLHNDIHDCDSILEKIEDILAGFQNELGSISAEIQTLQDRSTEISLKLKNRKAIEGTIDGMVEQLVIPPNVIEDICNSDIGPDFIESLQEIDRKWKQIQAPDLRNITAANDVRTEIEKLRMLACDRSRKFLLNRVYKLRKPMTNIQMHQQNSLLIYKALNSFLLTNHAESYNELKTQYIETMSKVYSSMFKLYIQNVMKHKFEDMATKDDLLGADEMAKRGISSFFSARSAATKTRAHIFALGDRGQLFQNLQEAVLRPHVAEKNDNRYFYEEIFRSMNYILLDNCCAEYKFLEEFFFLSPKETQAMFNKIMQKSFQAYMRHYHEYFPSCYDTIALLSCVRIIKSYGQLMKQRRLRCLNKYFEVVLGLLVPRFNIVIDLNLDSVRTLDVSRLGDITKQPHHYTRRFAEFFAALLHISSGYVPEVDDVLMRTRIEVETFIARVAGEFNGRRDQLVFTINNYDLLLSIIEERISGESHHVVDIQQVLQRRTEEFVREELSHVIESMILFVQDYEPHLEKGTLAQVNFDVRRIEQIARSFNRDWKGIIESSNSRIMELFSNFQNGAAVVQAVLTQLLVYYERFQRILAQRPFRDLPIRQELVSKDAVRVEIKKYRGAY